MRTRPAVIGISILIVSSLASSPAAAAIFEQIGAVAFGNEGIFKGVRAEALGSADVAGAQEAEALLINPAPVPSGGTAGVSYGRLDWIVGDFESVALAARWKSLRLGLVRTQYTVVDQELLLPSRPGGTWDLRSRIDVVGLSWDVLRTLAPDARPFWIAGASYRRYSEHFASEEMDADTFDLGSTFGISWERSGQRITVASALVWQNVTDAEVDGPFRPARAPRPVRYGLSAEAGMPFGPRSWQRIDMRLSVAGTHESDRPGGDRTHLGAEIGFGHALYVRAGSDEVENGNEISVGAGVRARSGPLTFGADWTRLEHDSDLTDEAIDIFGASLSYVAGR